MPTDSAFASAASSSRSGIIHLVIADDHVVVRDGLAGILSAQPDIEVLGEAADGPEAVEAYFRLAPDVLVLDLRMPKLDGFEVLTRILQREPAARVLIMSTYDGDQDVFRALKIGARGYLLKDAPRAQIVEAVRRVAGGERYTQGDIASKLLDHMSGPELTERELQVIRQVAEGRSNKDIARRLGITEGTVKSHIKNLLFKLNAISRTEAVTIATRRGYVKVT